MTPEDWQHVKPILDSALQLDSARRSAFLKEACADPSLRLEIESLIAAHERADGNALNASFFWHSTLTSGTRLGDDFQIVSLLGAGGMGEVYRARDLRLDRDVAIKILPRFVSLNLERLRRFEQEAKAAAALNHPNILGVFQLGSHAGSPYLVSELLEGETLREQLKRGPISSPRAIDYGVQIVHGLAAAHEKGIVHRDLKPENLFVTTDGRVKILDFGLAKLTHTESKEQLTQQTLETQPGTVLGTIGYMAPEQIRGQQADYRADIFAFGAILYEMLTGKRAYFKPTAAETMSAILNDDPPPISNITSGVAPAVERAVQRCLQKKPEHRFQSASDLAFALEVSSDSASAFAGATSVLRHTNWKWITAAGVALVLFSGTLLWRRSGSSRRLTEKDTIVLADFINRTGDPVFDGTLREGLAVELEQSPFLSLISDDRVQQTLHMMNQPSNAQLTPKIAREICQRTASAAVLDGSISNLGNEYVLDVKAINCLTGETLTEELAQAGRKEDVLKVLSGVSVKIRSSLGESLGTIQKYALPVEQATTSSLEALKAFSLGVKTWAEKGEVESTPFYKRAIELDPKFAQAYAQLGTIYVTDLLDPTAGADYMRKAYELRDHVSEREKFNITGGYYAFVTGELEKSAESYDFYAQAYPKDYFAYSAAGLMYEYLGQYEKAAARQRESIRLNPDYVSAYSNLMEDLVALNRLDEAVVIYRQATDRNLDGSFLHDGRYLVAFIQGDNDEMPRQVALAMGKPGSEDDMFSVESDTEAFYGRRTKARQFTTQASASALRAEQKETAALWQLYSALADAEFGYSESARQTVKTGLAIASTRDTQILAALALSRTGEEAQVQALAGQLERQFPLNTALNHYWLPTVRAYVALHKKHPLEAVTQLEAAAPYEMGFLPPQVGPGGLLYPAYVRGQAYLALQKGAEAALEFRKLLDHRSMLGNSPLYSLAHLYLARAFALQADKTNARKKYEEFFALWKDADPDIPVLKEAKAEDAKLK